MTAFGRFTARINAVSVSAMDPKVTFGKIVTDVGEHLMRQSTTRAV
jgi:hypothetical protein